MNVIVTGAAGYIGGQIVLQLSNAGHTVIGIDQRALPKQLDGVMDFVHTDFVSDQSYKKILDFRPEAIIHCAGTSLVGPSIINPRDYYNNNVVKTLQLLNTVLTTIPKTRFIFSSSAATYGEPFITPCHEVDPCAPVSPYGQSKFMVEMMLESYRRAYGLDYVAFRYFNACGADMQARHGQEPGATHIIARVLESLRDNKPFTLNGTTYPTPDGTCIRDYVHVQDIADAHVSALYHNLAPGVYNLGTNKGTSNAEIIAAAERITGHKLQVVLGDQRPGDPAVLTASSDKFRQVYRDWQKYSLDDMISHAWNWYTKK